MTTTRDPRVIEGIDMKSVPRCDVFEDCQSPADVVIKLDPCCCLTLSCAPHADGYRRYFNRLSDKDTLHCRKCGAEMVYFTVVPL